MLKASKIMLNMWTFDIFKPRAFKSSRGPLHWLRLTNILWKILVNLSGGKITPPPLPFPMDE